MEPALDAPAAWLTVLVLAIFLASGILWYYKAEPKRRIFPVEGNQAALPAWNIGWVNFGLFICAVILAITFVQLVVYGALSIFDPELIAVGSEDGASPSPLLVIAGILSMQVPMFAVFYLLRVFMPDDFGCELNAQRLTLFESFRSGLVAFLKYMPIIWFGALIWNGFLSVLTYVGLIGETNQQEIITFVQKGADPITLTLTVISIVAVAPIVEELIFRGGIYRFFKSKLNLLSAQILSGLLFSAIHMNLQVFFALTLAGIFFAHVYEKSGNLYVAMWFHCIFNSFTMIILLLTSLSDVAI